MVPDMERIFSKSNFLPRKQNVELLKQIQNGYKECLSVDIISLHPQRLEHSILGIGIEAGLEFCKQLTGDAGDIADAGHW